MTWCLPTPLLQQLGIELSVYVVLMSWIVIGLKSGNQTRNPWCENNQVAGTCCSAVGVWHVGWHEDSPSWTDGFGAVGIAERKFAFKYMPSFVIGMVDVQGCRTTALPFMDAERIPRCGKSLCFHRQILAPRQRS